METKTPKYSVRHVQSAVNVSSSYNYTYTMTLKWGDGIRRADFDLMYPELWMHYQDRRRGKYEKSMVTKYPKYLFQEINLAIYEQLLKGCKFYEYDRDRNMRYTDLRYHCQDLFHAQVRMAAGNLTPDSYPRMVDIFNQYMPIGQRFQTTSDLGDIVISTGLAKLYYGSDGPETPRLPIRREKNGSIDRWLLKFVSPIFEENGDSANA